MARCFLASGIGPGGEGDNTILAFDFDRRMLPSWKVRDPELSPLDLAIAPSGNVVVSSENPFGAADAVTTIREYDRADGHLVRVLVPNDSAGFSSRGACALVHTAGFIAWPKTRLSPSISGLEIALVRSSRCQV
jgi:hypothetical protein